MKAVFISTVLFLGIASCTIIRPGEVGVKRTLGKLSSKVEGEGPKMYNPFVSVYIVVPIRTVNLETKLSLPSKEGLTIESEISVLYNLKKEFVPLIIQNVGKEYERTFILNTLRSASANISSQHFAKDMHSLKRGEIEIEITQMMNDVLAVRGFEIQQVLLKSIKLPQRLSEAIEDKLKAEQEFQRMEFVLQKEKLEADRKVVEAEGIKNYQHIINAGLSPMLIQFQTIEAFKELSNSPNTKIIITDGKTPLIISE
jgi:prohibitin 1